MNIIKKVVVFVMGLVVIGVVATTISVVTQPKNVEKSVTFEVLTLDIGNNRGTVTNGTNDKLRSYSKVENEIILNIISIKHNDIEQVEIHSTILNSVNNSIEIVTETVDLEPLYTNDEFSTPEGNSFNVGDTISITFDVEQKTPVIIKTLLLLTPLILSASLIGYLSLSTKKGD